MYAMSVVVEGSNNMEFLYGGFDDLQYIKAIKSQHRNTRTTHTPVALQQIYVQCWMRVTINRPIPPAPNALFAFVSRL